MSRNPCGLLTVHVCAQIIGILLCVVVAIALTVGVLASRHILVEWIESMAAYDQKGNIDVSAGQNLVIMMFSGLRSKRYFSFAGYFQLLR